MKINKSSYRIWAPCFALCSLATAAWADTGAPADATSGAAASADSTAWTLSTPFDWVNSVFTKASDDYGVTPSFSYTANVQGNPVGGLSRSAAYAHNIVFGVDLDLDKIAGIDGASFTITGVQAAGRDLSGRNIGNAFGVAQAFVGQGTYLYQMYWQQQLADEVVTIQLGRMNGSNYASLPAFGLQMTGGINGNPDSLFFNNSAFLGTPNAVWGANIQVQPDSEYYVSSGIFQATRLPGNNHGTDFSYRSSDRLMVMAEAGWTPTFGKETEQDNGYGGTYIVGMYYTNLPQDRYDSSGTLNHTVGFYLMGQQTVWQSTSGQKQSIDVWGGMTYAPQTAIAEMPFMGFAGVVWNGAIPGREQDQVLGTMLVGTFGSDYADSQLIASPQDGRPTYEMVFELSYIFNINSYAYVQPDIQYVIRPNGIKTTNDALVLGLQFGVNF